MACSTAAGAEVTALVLRRLVPSPFAGPSRISVVCRTRHRRLRTRIAAQHPQKSTTGADSLNEDNVKKDEATTSTNEERQRVGDLADVISGLGKALQRKGHLLEILLLKYDCMQLGQVNNLKSYFKGKMFDNKIWTGTVEGLPVYFIEPQHPAKFFWMAQYYGEHDDSKRFSYFSRAALELLYQSGKKIDIIHCHNWQTAFVAPLYWDVYANLGFNSTRICFTCHNFEYQETAPARDLFISQRQCFISLSTISCIVPLRYHPRLCICFTFMYVVSYTATY